MYLDTLLASSLQNLKGRLNPMKSTPDWDDDSCFHRDKLMINCTRIANADVFGLDAQHQGTKNERLANSINAGAGHLSHYQVSLSAGHIDSNASELCVLARPDHELTTGHVALSDGNQWEKCSSHAAPSSLCREDSSLTHSCTTRMSLKPTPKSSWLCIMPRCSVLILLRRETMGLPRAHSKRLSSSRSDLSDLQQRAILDPELGKHGKNFALTLT
ncbi:hypothetical protein CA85_22540 [Allorhodopirellula solitaria]|uniref:Uncharacterized protein n=1 Tax=Allorhodopirellula solitaria TaxID=2527987 RepID=A0A5C5XWZ7_9BACT|nr:hypothetical protein CA85_22540 [Allorhodopirellula solitaria]